MKYNSKKDQTVQINSKSSRRDIILMR